MTLRFSAVVETGSCSINPDEAGMRRWEEKANCGHKHRTYDAALACLESKREIRNGQCSALWYNGTVHDADGHRAIDAMNVEAERAEAVSHD